MNVIDTRVIKKRRTDSCTNGSTRRSTYVPDELVTMILLFLPGDVLYNVMRYACKQWYNIIQSLDFISSHLEKSTRGPTGLCMNNYGIGYFPKYSSKISFSYKARYDHLEVNGLKFKCVDRVRLSCNGLVFVLGPQVSYRGGCPCYVANLATKHYLPLPIIPSLNGDHWGFAYAATSKVYKVLYPSSRLLILTVGVDKKWREVASGSLRYTVNWIGLPRPLSLRGFIYWIYEERILCFDIETETFRQIPLPTQYRNIVLGNHGVIAMGASLCFWYKKDSYLYEFLLLKDHDEWENVASVNLTGQMGVIKELLKVRIQMYPFQPCGWLRNGELLVFGAERGIFIYNVNTQEIHQRIEMKENSCLWRCFHSYPHIDSLVPVNNLALVTDGPPRKNFICRDKIYSKDNMMAEFENPVEIEGPALDEVDKQSESQIKKP